VPNVFVVLVARAGAAAKSRLASVLNPAERQALVLAMLADVQARCHATSELSGVFAVTHPSVALDPRTLRVDDSAEGDMNAAVRAGIAAAVAHGAETVIVLPADIPCMTSADLRTLLAATNRAERVVVVGASRDAHGTNALLLRPPDAIPPSFGPPSADRHVSLARAANCHAVVLADLGLSLDVDTPEDLAALRAMKSLPPETARILKALP
jgi:2-phospho-L-lactate guanylyltransferase